MPDVRQNMLAQDMKPFISTPEQFAALMVAESAKFAPHHQDDWNQAGELIVVITYSMQSFF